MFELQQRLIHETYGPVTVLDLGRPGGLVQVAPVADVDASFWCKPEALGHEPSALDNLKRHLDHGRVRTLINAYTNPEEPWVQHLLRSTLVARMHPDYLDTFALDYLVVTGDAVTSDTPGVQLHDKIWRCVVTFRVSFSGPMPADLPKFLHVVESRSNLFHITNTKLGWRLIELGMRIGGNARAVGATPTEAGTR